MSFLQSRHHVAPQPPALEYRHSIPSIVTTMGGIVTIRGDNALMMRMSFQGLDGQQAHVVWRTSSAERPPSRSDLSFAIVPWMVEIAGQRL
jgi:hypothetical protein